jgi:hypothetical protein
MSEEHQIVSRVREAKSDPDAADGFIREYMGFIKAETAKFTGRVPQEGRDDELSVAMLAFYESILAYDASRGPFLRFAALSMRSRLIDYARAENRHGAPQSPTTNRRRRAARPSRTALPTKTTPLPAPPTGSPPARRLGNFPSGSPTSGSPSPTWRTTVPVRSGRFPPAAG